MLYTFISFTYDEAKNFQVRISTLEANLSERKEITPANLIHSIIPGMKRGISKLIL
jgi:hypothetical protein